LNHFKKYFNPRVGLAGALIMGGIVFYINKNYGWFLATTAGLKQAAYTFFFGGIIVKVLEYFLTSIKNRYVSVPLSVLIVSAITTFLVFIVHNLKGTPEPFLSTIPTLFLAPPGFLGLAIRFKKKGKS
jgi:uncharacterized membrane protein